MAFDIDVVRMIGNRTIALSCRTGTGVTVITGPSGVGKTSILNMVAGLLQPDRGYIRIGGRALFDSDRGIDLAIAERGIGYVFQDRRLFPHMRVRANLLYGCPKGARWKMDDIVDMLGIGHLLARWPSDLSGGEIQRVAIGRALLSAPRCLLFDEPLSSLDGARKVGVQDAIDRICKEMNTPILYVTHDLAEADRLSAHVIVMTDETAQPI